MQGGPDKIPVRSEPEGARVLLNGMPVGTTPMVVSVGHRDSCSIDLQKDGYQTVHIDKGKVLSGWIFGNIILGGLIGIGIDLASQNQGHYSEDPIYSVLQPVKLEQDGQNRNPAKASVP